MSLELSSRNPQLPDYSCDTAFVLTLSITRTVTFKLVAIKKDTRDLVDCIKYLCQLVSVHIRYFIRYSVLIVHYLFII
jgi:hypothetical protein